LIAAIDVVADVDEYAAARVIGRVTDDQVMQLAEQIEPPVDIADGVDACARGYARRGRGAGSWLGRRPKEALEH